MTTAGPWLSEDEVLAHRMEAFHRRRVEAVASGESPLGGPVADGVLVVHLIPRSGDPGRRRFDGAALREHGGRLSACGDDGRYAASRFNVDGLLLLDSGQEVGAYTQIFRDGRVESAMSAITFQAGGVFPPPGQEPPDRPRYLRHEDCQRAVIKLLGQYLAFCAGLGLAPPVMMFSAVVGCRGVQFHTGWGPGRSGGIDRSPAFLPDIEIPAVDADPIALLRPWCDTLLQACGLDRSPNFDEAGNWQERRR